MSTTRIFESIAAIAASLLLSGYTGFPVDSATQADGGAAKFKAVVRDARAEFSFPVDPKQDYTWCLFGRNYNWNVEVGDNLYNIGYLSGFAPYRNGDPKCVTGKLKEMLLNGQSSIFKAKGGTELAVMPQIAMAAELGQDGTTLVLRLWDEKAIREIFSGKPKEVAFQWRSPEKKASARVAVEYPSTEDPAVVLAVSRIIGRWGTTESAEAIEFRQDGTWSIQGRGDGKSESGRWMALDGDRVKVDSEDGQPRLLVTLRGTDLLVNEHPLHKIQ